MTGRQIVLVVVASALALVGAVVIVRLVGDETGPNASSAIWISEHELSQLPTAGPAWDQTERLAAAPWGPADIGDQDSDHNTSVLAGAYVAVRLNDVAMRTKVADALREVEGTSSENILALARNIPAYVIAADVIGHRTDTFANWLKRLLDDKGAGRAGLDTLRAHAMSDPTNHGSHARAAVLSIARYLDDRRLVDEVASRFHDWLGRSSRGFEWRALDWQADPERPVGINAADSTIQSADVDGVLPEEQRRAGPFTDPAPQEGYVWEALQGAVVTAEILDRSGFKPWQWESNALWRAFRWLYLVNDFPATGDDEWQPWIVNRAYDGQFPAPSPARPGKNMGFTDWTHAMPQSGDQHPVAPSISSSILVAVVLMSNSDSTRRRATWVIRPRSS